jgi:hypothetical protein
MAEGERAATGVAEPLKDCGGEKSFGVGASPDEHP